MVRELETALPALVSIPSPSPQHTPSPPPATRKHPNAPRRRWTDLTCHDTRFPFRACCTYSPHSQQSGKVLLEMTVEIGEGRSDVILIRKKSGATAAPPPPPHPPVRLCPPARPLPPAGLPLREPTQPLRLFG
eukprot:SAG22_NODE_6425_length_857_cov_1.055409_1_plen_133_part_00